MACSAPFGLHEWERQGASNKMPLVWTTGSLQQQPHRPPDIPTGYRRARPHTSWGLSARVAAHVPRSASCYPICAFRRFVSRSHLQQQVQAYFNPSGTILAQENLAKFFLRDASNSPNRAKSHALWPSGQVRALCTEIGLDECSLSLSLVSIFALSVYTAPTLVVESLASVRMVHVSLAAALVAQYFAPAHAVTNASSHGARCICVNFE